MLYALLLLFCSCGTCFVDQPSSAAPVSNMNIEVRLSSVFGMTDRPIAYLGLSDTWTADGATPLWGTRSYDPNAVTPTCSLTGLGTLKNQGGGGGGCSLHPNRSGYPFDITFLIPLLLFILLKLRGHI